MIVGPYGNYVFGVVGRGVAGILVVVARMVSGGGDEPNSLFRSLVDRFLHGGGITAASPGIGGHAHPDLGGVGN